MFEVLERRELMASDFSPAVKSALGTMLFESQADYQRVGNLLAAKFGNGGGSQTGGGESDAPVNTNEIEPNSVRATANLLPLGTASGKSAIVNVAGQMQNIFDEDYYAFDLRKGDILDVRIITSLQSAVPGLVLQNSAGTELLFSADLFYPPAVGRPIPTKSPRFTNGTATLSYVIDTDGRYFLRVGDANGAYNLNLRAYRPTIEQEPIGTKQIIYLDFDGGLLRNDLLSLDAIAGVPPQTLRVPSINAILPTLGLTNADAPSVIRDITARVEKKLRFQLAADTNNGFYGATGNAGEFDIAVVSSLDSPELWGQPNVSRVFVGGTQADFGIAGSGLLGIAESIDVGNFDREDTALVMVDSTAADAIDTIGLPRAGNISVATVFAELTAMVIAHEAGHFLGGMHQEPTSSVNTIMDAFYAPLISSGAGRDGIFGNADDVPLRFINDEYRIAETSFGGGINNSGQILAFGMSTGTVGGSIVGTVFNDTNRNARLDSGETGLGPWDVFADVNNNGTRDLGEPRTNSDAQGKYTLRVAPGTYTIRLNRPGSWVPSTTSELTKTVTVTAGSTVTTNFGSVLPTSAATGYKYLDINGDGIRDANEPGLAGVYIYLDLDGDDRPDLGEPASITKADGSYSLTPPSAGTYTIREVVEPGYVQTFPASGEHIVTYNGSTALAGYDFLNTESSDWGDAPAPYATTRAQNGASHGATPGLRLGTAWDAEQDGQPSAAGTGDDTNGVLGTGGTVVDDEDGVVVLAPIVRGDAQNALQVTVTNTTGTASYLQGWVDFNGNGLWTDPGEQIITNALVVNGTNLINFSTPLSAVNQTMARFRLSQDKDLLPTGKSKTGEVEDYQFNIVNGPRKLLQNDAFTVARSSVANTFDVLANDFTMPGDPWTITGRSSGSAGGTVSIDTTRNVLVYRPPTGFIGRETFTYTATSLSGRQETATVTVDVVLQFNDPLAVDDSFDVPTNSVSYPLNVLANDIEGKTGALRVNRIVTQPSRNGSVVIGTGGLSIRYTPVNGFGGTEQFQYEVIDDAGKKSIANVTIHTLEGDRADDQVAFSFKFFDMFGKQITAVKQGDSFQAVVYVDDLRPEAGLLQSPPVNVPNPGVYAAYLDVLYSAGLVSPAQPSAASPLDFEVEFVDPYNQGRSGTSATPGLIDDLGAFLGNVSTYNQPFAVPVAKMTFQARSAGLAEFVGDPADRPPQTDVTFFNANNASIPTQQIRYGRSTIEIVPNGVQFPIAVDDSPAQVIAGNTTAINVMANDTIGAQGPIRIANVSQPLHGDVRIDDRGTPSNVTDDVVLYTSLSNYTGIDQFTYTIADVAGFTSTATVTIRVGDTSADDVAQLRLEATNLAGTPIDTITVGSQFQLRGYVKDLRANGANRGVFAAFQDILYNSGLVSVNTKTEAPGFQIEYTTSATVGYNQGTSGDIRVAGLINEVGSVQNSSTSTGSSELLQFTITLTAKATGVANFVGDPADIKPYHDTLMFDPTSPLSVDQIRYLSDSITIISAGGSGGGGGEGNTNLTNRYDVNNDGFVSPIDVLILVNSMNSGGGGALGGSGGNGAGGEGEGEKYYVDVNGDGFLSPLDALWVINALNNNGNGNGEGEGSDDLQSVLPTIVQARSESNVRVDIPFIAPRLISTNPAFVMGPMPYENAEAVESTLADYFASQMADEGLDEFLDGIAGDVLRSRRS